MGGGFTTVIPKKDRPLLVEKKIQTPPKKIIKQPILLLHGKRLKTPPVEEDVDWSQMEKKHALQKQKKTETPQKTETPHVEEEVDWSQIHKKCAPQTEKKAAPQLEKKAAPKSEKKAAPKPMKKQP